MDTSYLFDNYLESVKRYKDTQAALQPNRDNRPNPLLVDLLAKERVGVVPTLGRTWQGPMLPRVLMPSQKRGRRLRLELFYEESTRKGMRKLSMVFELA